MELELLRDRLSVEVERHGEIDLAILFGSRPRGDARPTSDADLAVLGHGIDNLGVAAALSTSLGLTFDVVDLSSDPPIALLLAVLRDGVRVFERRAGAYGRFLAHTLSDLETDLPSFRIVNQAFVQRVAERGLSGGG